jgi:hypothetical protein
MVSDGRIKIAACQSGPHVGQFAAPYNNHGEREHRFIYVYGRDDRHDTGCYSALL